jgi:hypothetical protein
MKNREAADIQTAQRKYITLRYGEMNTNSRHRMRRPLPGAVSTVEKLGEENGRPHISCKVILRVHLKE